MIAGNLWRRQRARGSDLIRLLLAFPETGENCFPAGRRICFALMKEMVVRDIQRAGKMRMSSNENPYPPPQRVQEAVAAAAALANQRPDDMCRDLSAAIARKYSVPVEHVLVVPGSAAFLSMLVTTQCRGQGEVLHAWPSFELYPFLAQTAGIKAVPVPLADHVHDVDSMVQAATADTRVAVLCNPNNPTGTTLSAAEIQRFLNGIPKDTTVVIDEAYREFAAADLPDGIDFYRTDERVCVVRSFSKAYGLFGLRVGYVVAHEPLRSTLALALRSFTVNGVGQAAALAAVEAEDEMRQRCADIIGERDRMRAALLAQGWQVPRSEANFVWLPMDSDAVEPFVDFCAERGALVHGFAGWGVRVSVADSVSNSALIDIADQFRKERALCQPCQ